ncbi:class I SAM-dependent methyltransferase [Acaryochloris sp. 'Moss Beach']|uniref:class I SAM-dependent methyltransferase n=1 Tax=Acaryochloris sp. 'Moss Beach' TaxID=2740837 RepID=UPI001F2388B3|nr:class I SAM-dependent methyltransferase [Acaryochloris sp. 'Moss Beach']UJB69007.1 class I SAM-dependent methyltransferase [Acaryochloris sp. 'Moss Beach']
MTITLKQYPKCISDLFTCGLMYAVAEYKIHSPQPLTQSESWDFWTQPRSSFMEWLARTYPLKTQRMSYLNRMLDHDHASGIETHYDVSNDFYALFLDERYRFYTCAEFQSEQDSLEEAQTNKAQYLLSLMQLQGTESVLDLGCGWGAMLKFLQDSGHQGQLAGYTLSKEQLTYGQQQLGLNVSLTNFITNDFVEAPYERIFSIGALEHVRPHELKDLYQKIYDALVPGGLAVHQFFSLEREPYPTSMVLMQLFFPGSLLSMHETHLQMAQEVGFHITHDSIHDYQPTLQAWYQRLAKKQDTAIELVGLEIFNRYMTFFPTAWLFFQQHEAELHRVVMEKPETVKHK